MRAVEPSHSRLSWPAVALLACAALGAACSNNNTTTTTTPSTTIGTKTETMVGIMAPNGTANRTFLVTTPGTVTVQLAAVDPAMTLGLGIGIRSATGADCRFSQTVNTPAGTTAQLSAQVDAGLYCAGTYDLGNVGQNGVTVTVTVTHP